MNFFAKYPENMDQKIVFCTTSNVKKFAKQVYISKTIGASQVTMNNYRYIAQQPCNLQSERLTYMYNHLSS